MHAEEVALDLKEQSGERVGITLNVSKLVVINVKVFAEVGEQRLALKEICVVVELRVVFCVIIILVVDLTHNLLQDVLKSDDAAGSTKLVNHDGNVDLVLLKLAHEVVDLLGLRHEIRRTDKALPTKVGWLRQVRQQVLDVEHAAHVVLVFLIHGNATVVVLHNTFQHVSKTATDVEVDDVLTTGHHLLCRLVAKPDDAFQHALLVFDVVLVGELQRLLQIIHAQHMVLLLHHLLCQDATTQQHRLKRPENATHDHDASHRATTEAKRILTAEHLRHNLAEEQQKERQQHGYAQKLQPHSVAKVDELSKDIIAQHDDGHVNEVVGNENGCQRALTVITQQLYLLVARRLRGVKFRDVAWRQTEKCYL